MTQELYRCANQRSFVNNQWFGTEVGKKWGRLIDLRWSGNSFHNKHHVVLIGKEEEKCHSSKLTQCGKVMSTYYYGSML